MVTGHTCTQGGCHSPTNAAGAPQVPAGKLDLTNAASNEEPLQPTSYRRLLFAHNSVIMALTPTDPTATQTVAVGPYLNAGSANGGLSAQFMSRFAPGRRARTPDISARRSCGWFPSGWT